MAHGLLKKLT